MAKDTPRSSACQTLYRGLDIIAAIADGYTLLPAISEHIDVSLSTTYRLATALVQEGYLQFENRKGYRLGAKLIQLGFQAYGQLNLPSIARPYLELLAQKTLDTVHLAVRDKNTVFYLDKVSGQRAVQISSAIGGKKHLCATGVGKALLLDSPTNELQQIYQQWPTPNCTVDDWIVLMNKYKVTDYAFDLGEDDEMIRCVAAPIRDGSHQIVAAISVSSAIQYMDQERMLALVPEVKKTAGSISKALGGR
jgi:DNA-binding IclR family transcriptional regulator